MTNEPYVIERMDSWARLLAEKIITKEMQHIPPAVAAMACVYYIRNLTDRVDTVLKHDDMAKIILNGKEPNATVH